MPTPTRKASPAEPDVRQSRMIACRRGRGRGSGCVEVLSLRCHACGWWEVLPEEDDPCGTLPLWAPGTHTRDDCHARQLDPDLAARQDNAKRQAAGLA